MRKGQIILLLAALVCFTACRPRGVLSSRQMRNVMYDLHRADAIIQVKGYNYGHDEDIAKYYQVVLDKHHVTKAEFDSSLVWYTDHPQLFTRIYPKIMKRCQHEMEYWGALESEAKANNVPKRELPPIEDVMKTVQQGFEICLLPDSITEIPQVQELLLPLGRNDSISSTTSISATSSDASSNSSAASKAKPASPDTSEDIIDGKTPAERRREQQLERLQERLKIKPATAQ